MLQPMKRRRLLITLALAAGALSGATACSGTDAGADPGWPEKEQLTLGFIKLTDMAPLAIAYEKGYFENEGLYVTLEAQTNWKVLFDQVISGELDGAHMLAGQPLAASIGYGTRAEVITALSMNRNGNAITVSNAVWEQMREHVPNRADGLPRHPISASALKPVVDAYRLRGETFRMGMVFPVSPHNYELRYWLAAGGIHPGFYAPERGDTTGQIDADVLLSVTPPPQMPSTLHAGTIQGYCAGEPWNQQAVTRKIGVAVITDYQIWPNNPEKVFGVSRAWAEQYPHTHQRVIKALIRAAHWLDQPGNREEAVQILSRSHYVGADAEVIANSMRGSFEYEAGDYRAAPDFNVFFRYHATYPFYSDAVWYLTQMRRWGQIHESRPDEWYHRIARRVYRPDLYRKAALALVAEGHFAADDFPDFAHETGYRPVETGFIDGVAYDGREPNAYLQRFAIGLKENREAYE